MNHSAVINEACVARLSSHIQANEKTVREKMCGKSRAWLSLEASKQCDVRQSGVYIILSQLSISRVLGLHSHLLSTLSDPAPCSIRCSPSGLCELTRPLISVLARIGMHASHRQPC
jgi:hypothetical protein